MKIDEKRKQKFIEDVGPTLRHAIETASKAVITKYGFEGLRKVNTTIEEKMNRVQDENQQ